MQHNLQNLKSFKKWFAKSWIQWLMAVIIFFSTAYFYMGSSSTTQCYGSSPSLFSDSSGGLGWSQWASGNALTWGYTYYTNYPVGEVLNRPQEITSQTLLLPYRFLSWITTPVCGLNLLILLAYMSTALTMFGLIRWLFKRSSIAIFAGYAAAFVPYHQLKSQSHITYMNSATFIGLVWAYLWLIEKPTYKKAALIAAISAISIYFDGYFVLLTVSLLAVLAFVTLFKGVSIKRILTVKRSKSLKVLRDYLRQNLHKYGKYFIVTGLLLFVLILPVLNYQLRYSSDISKSLASGRGTISADANAYSARPYEYLLPSYNSAFAPSKLKLWKAAHEHGSNPSEDTLFVGYTVAALAAVSLILLFRSSFSKLRLREDITYRYIVMSAISIVIICFLLSLPPNFQFLNHHIPTPTKVILHFTAYWRVFARYFLVLHPMLVVLAASGLYGLSRKWSGVKTTLLVAVCTVVLFFEYLPLPHRNIASLSGNTPAIYHQIAADSSVKVIAEYPMLNLAFGPLTFTFQQVHQKKMVNPNAASIIKQPFIQSITGLNDAQTLRALKSINTDLITTFGIDMSANPNLEVYKQPDLSAAGFGIPQIYSYKIINSLPKADAVLAPASGFDDAVVDNSQHSHHIIHGPAKLTIIPLNKNLQPSVSYDIQFKVVSLSYHDNSVIVKQDGKILWQGPITYQTGTVMASAKSSSTIEIIAADSADLTELSAQKSF